MYMSKIFSRIDWGRGVWVRQRTPLPSGGNNPRTPENFMVRLFTTTIVQKLHSDDYPVDQWRDIAEYDEWINQNLAPNLSDGIFYIQAYGWKTNYYRIKKTKQYRILHRKKDQRGYIQKEQYGIIALDKFEVRNGSVERHFQKRGHPKIGDRNKKPSYPIWLLLGKPK